MLSLKTPTLTDNKLLNIQQGLKNGNFSEISKHHTDSLLVWLSQCGTIGIEPILWLSPYALYIKHRFSQINNLRRSYNPNAYGEAFEQPLLDSNQRNHGIKIRCLTAWLKGCMVISTVSQLSLILRLKNKKHLLWQVIGSRLKAFPSYFHLRKSNNIGLLSSLQLSSRSTPFAN